MDLAQTRHYFRRHAYGTRPPQPAPRGLIAGLSGLEALKREAHRIFVRTLAERIAEGLDRMAGPYGLAPAERDIQQLCRDRFGLYDPGSYEQVRFVLDLFALATARSRPDSPEGLRSEPPEDEPAGQEMPQDESAQDELMVALLSHQQAQRGNAHPAPRHRRSDAAPRRPEPRGPDWGRYLVKWRSYQD